jgi:DNA polymerase-1
MSKSDLLKILDGISKDEKKSTFKEHDRVLIIDGLNLFLRNFAILNYINEHGVHIGGLSGFLRSLGFLINQINPTSVYIVFDGIGSSSNRKNLVPEYKSNRNTGKLVNWEAFDDIEEENDAKINQISRLIHYLKCIPVKTISMDKVEADDIIAYLSKHFEKENNSKVFIVSSDKDFLQLVTDNITVFRPTEKEFFTPKKIKDKFGLPAENFLLYKTLLGDKSDQISGIKGLGEKGIFKKFPELQNQILTLEDIFDICENKYKEHVIYSRVILEQDNISKNYLIMNLSNPLLDDKEKQEIQDVIKSDTPKLNADVFLKMYTEDGLEKVFKDISWWLRNNFTTLNSFSK